MHCDQQRKAHEQRERNDNRRHSLFARTPKLAAPPLALGKTPTRAIDTRMQDAADFRRRDRTQCYSRHLVRHSYWIPFAALAGLALTLPTGLQMARADGRADRADVLSVAQIKPGMKGYGLTVFEGTEPGKFDVEVIDVLTNFRPKQDLILVKTTHPRLEAAKVVAGMSGSPIYLNGKMVGAYAYGWSFGSEPIAGVTPIRNMLDDLARPLPEFIQGWPLKHSPAAQSRLEASSPNRYTGGSSTGDNSRYNLTEHREQLAARSGLGTGALSAANALGASVQSSVSAAAETQAALTPVNTPLLLGGMSTESVAFASELLSPLGLIPLQAGGGGRATDSNAPQRFVDGGAIGVQLIRGDVSAMGLGTVTRVEGDRLVAFGHPMMEGGVTALPTAIGKVLWFLASSSRSFKIGMPVREVGALVNDRQASIVVSHSAKAPVVPVTVHIKGVPGAPYTDWSFELAHEKFMAPSLLAVAIGNALQATAADRQDVSWNASSEIHFKGFPSITVEDFGVSIGGTPDESELVRSNVVSAVGAVLNNPWEPAFVERVEVNIELRYSREIYRLKGAELLDPEPEAGGEARVRLNLVPFAGPVVQRVIKLPVPKHLAGSKVKVLIRPGYAVEKPTGTPESLLELVGTLADPNYPPKSVVLSYDAGEGLTHRNHVALNLPPGVVDTASSTSSNVAPAQQKSERHLVTDLSYFLVGQDTVILQVKPIKQ
jgi:hypothetical protein